MGEGAQKSEAMGGRGEGGDCIQSGVYVTRETVPYFLSRDWISFHLDV